MNSHHKFVIPGTRACLAAVGAAALMLAGCSKSAEQRVADQLGLARQEVVRVRKNLGMSHSALMRLRRENVPEVVREAEHPDLPRYRAAFWAMLHRDERGVIPPGALFNAILQKTALRQRLPRTRNLIAGIPVRSPKLLQTAGLNPNHSGWTELGPASVGGRTRSIAIDPKNPSRMWVASVGGGVWLTIDGANTFAPVDDLMSNLVVSTLVVDPTNSNIVYAGTGEGFFNLDALRGTGIFRTTDGAMWRQLISTKGEAFNFVNRLAISPDGKTLLAATRSGIFVSNDPDRNDWNSRLTANVADVKFHPTDSKRAIAGGLDTGEAYYSEDAGGTWKTASHPGSWIHVWENGSASPSRVEVTYAMANPNIVYASVDNNSGEVWRSVDGGKTFTKTDSLTPDGVAAYHLGGQGWYGNAIWAGDPSNVNFVLAGGVNVWKSTDGGKTLTDISDWAADQSAHADHHVIIAHPGFNGATNKTVFFGNDGGIFVAQDVSTVGSDKDRIQGWARLNHNYGVTQFYGLAVSADGTVIGGAQDNGTLLLGKGGKPDSWSELFGGDGGMCAADASDPKYLYGEYILGNVHRRSEPGRPAEFISGQFWDAQNERTVWKNPPYVITDARSGNANFIAPFVLDPNDSNRMLVGGASLWRSNDVKTANAPDKGPQWRPIKDPAATFISAIAVAKGNSNVLWVGHNNGDFFTTTNGLATSPQWTLVAAQSLPRRVVTHITIDPNNMSILYVTFGGYSTGNIWKTTDAGAHWSNIATTLAAAPVFTVSVHPHNSRFLYAGTEVGIFASEDGGAHWSPGNEGPNNCAVFDLAWFGSRLFAATHGRGIFTIDLSSVPPQS